MRVDIDKIEIKEPPIEELSKKHSCFLRLIVTSCGCFVLAFLISLLILRFSVGPRTKELKDIPPEFKNTVTIYALDEIEKIEYTPGKQRGQIIEAAAYVPKLIISPFIIYFDKDFKYIPIPEEKRASATAWNKFSAFMKESITDHRNVYTLEWSVLDADPAFIEEFYKKGLEKLGFTIGTYTNEDGQIQFFFSKDTIDGTLRITDDARKEGTDSVILIIILPPT